MRFFITGLPRSRTAWFANYMSYGNTACFHDKFRDVGLSPAALRDYMESAGAESVGHSDAANLFVAEELIALYPASRWLVIRRDPAEVFESIVRYNPDIQRDSITAANDALEAFVMKWEPMVLSFNQLTPENVEMAAAFLSPSWTCPKWRTEMLCNMQVQLEPEFMKREVSRIKGEFAWAQ